MRTHQDSMSALACTHQLRIVVSENPTNEMVRRLIPQPL
jgi:hypothetical protein